MTEEQTVRGTDMENPGTLRDRTETFSQGTDHLAAPLPCLCLIPCTSLGQGAHPSLQLKLVFCGMTDSEQAYVCLLVTARCA